jgi:hypothetical protein
VNLGGVNWEDLGVGDTHPGTWCVALPLTTYTTNVCKGSEGSLIVIDIISDEDMYSYGTEFVLHSGHI